MLGDGWCLMLFVMIGSLLVEGGPLFVACCGLLLVGRLLFEAVGCVVLSVGCCVVMCCLVCWCLL